MDARALRVLQTAGVFVAIALGALAYIHTDQPIGNFPDFSAFYAAGARGPIYNGAWLTSIQPGEVVNTPFAYPPTFVLICRLLRLAPFDIAFSAWSAVTGTVFLEAARRFAPRLWWLALVAPAVTVAFREGQTTLLIGGLSALAFSLRERRWLAGAIYGAAFCLKPQVLLLIPVMLMFDRSWRTLLALGLAGAAACLASLALGPGLWTDWLEALPGFYKFNKDLGVTGLGATGLWWWGGAALSVSALYLSRSDPPPVRLMAVTGGSLLISPHAMFYEQAMLVPAALGLCWPLSGSVLAGLIVLAGRVTGPFGLAIALTLNAVGPRLDIGRWRPRRGAAGKAEPLAS